MRYSIVLIALVALSWQLRRAQAAIDASPHTVQFVYVEKNVKLEVLDWGGDGPPLVFLAGLGDTAHTFDAFAPKLTDKHHVYGITRRGFGASSAPAPTDENYDADRLGDDVLEVIDALKLNHPVIAGHSIAGEELSSVGTRHPEKIAGLIYLDAADSYAFYIPGLLGAFDVDVPTMRRDLAQLLGPKGNDPAQARTLLQEIQDTFLQIQKHMEFVLPLMQDVPESPPNPPRTQTQSDSVWRAMRQNERKYTDIRAPVLAILAVPHACQPNCDNPIIKLLAADDRARADGIEAGVPSAHVVRLPYADHVIWRSNEADVLREMNAFMDSLSNTTPKAGN